MCYAPWFLNLTWLPKPQPIISFKAALERIEKEYLTPGKALHSWYITEDLILLADDDIEEDVKLELLKKLGNCYKKK